jgi:rSAM/selenodomain-associated transferase 1
MEKSDTHTAVALFVRQPVPGRVKTRLAHDLGDQAACDLYGSMVADILEQVTKSELPLYLFHDGPSDAELPLTWCATSTRVIRQTGESLGERMTAAIEQTFAAGYTHAVVTGSDVPGIIAPILHEAVSELYCHDVVIVPAFDGGYCLIAVRGDHFSPVIFRDIPWSSSHVLRRTIETCVANGLTFKLLEPLRDIDTLEDLEEYCREPSPLAMETNRWLAGNGFICRAADSSPDR